MLRVVSVIILSLGLAACSVGHVSLPFVQPAAPAKSPVPAHIAGKAGLGGPAAAHVAMPASWTTASTAKPGMEAVPGALDLINELRHEKGLKPLAVSPELTRAAQTQAAHLARSGTLSHIGPDGSTPLDRARLAGFRPAMAAENIAGGQASDIDAVRSWRESEGHLRNMLLADATHMGIAHISDPRSPQRTYWTLVLGATR